MASDSFKVQYLLSVPGGLGKEATPPAGDAYDIKSSVELGRSPWPGTSAVIIPWPSQISLDSMIPSQVSFTADSHVVHRNGGKGIRGRVVRVSGSIVPMMAAGDTVSQKVARSAVGKPVAAPTHKLAYRLLLDLVNLIEDVLKTTDRPLHLYMLDEGYFLEVEPRGAVRLTRPPTLRTGLQYDLELLAVGSIVPPRGNMLARQVPKAVAKGQAKIGLKEALDIYSNCLTIVTDLANLLLFQPVFTAEKMVNQVLTAVRGKVDEYEALQEQWSKFTHTGFRVATQVKSILSKSHQVSDEIVRATYAWGNNLWWDSRLIQGSTDGSLHIRPESGMTDESDSVTSVLLAEMDAQDTEYMTELAVASELAQSLGARRYIRVQNNDTIESIALRATGDSRRWRELADLNDLRAPYISSVSDSGVLTPGELILVPSLTVLGPWPLPDPSKMSTMSEEELIFGIDLAQTSDGDWKKAVGSDGEDGALDVELVGGLRCFEQSILNRLKTKKGTNQIYPNLGITPTVGMKSTDSVVAPFSVDAVWQIRSDDRTETVKDFEVTDHGNGLGFTATIVGANSENFTVSGGG